jgi:hypothetical protein
MGRLIDFLIQATVTLAFVLFVVSGFTKKSPKEILEWIKDFIKGEN